MTIPDFDICYVNPLSQKFTLPNFCRNLTTNSTYQQCSHFRCILFLILLSAKLFPPVTQSGERLNIHVVFSDGLYLPCKEMADSYSTPQGTLILKQCRSTNSCLLHMGEVFLLSAGAGRMC